jgi:hypothetical protein
VSCRRTSAWRKDLKWFAEVVFGSVVVALTCCHIERFKQEVTKICSLSWLTNSALVYELKCGRRGGVAGSQPMSTVVHRSPNKLWRSNSISNLWVQVRKGRRILD